MQVTARILEINSAKLTTLDKPSKQNNLCGEKQLLLSRRVNVVQHVLNAVKAGTAMTLMHENIDARTLQFTST